MDKKEWYYYLHTNGDLIGKNPVFMNADDFKSDFVKRAWLINLYDRGDCWTMLLEALAMGVRIYRVKELALLWKCDYTDSIEFIRRIKPNELMKKGIEIFIKEILGMEVEDYWKKLEKLGEKESNEIKI